MKEKIRSVDVKANVTIYLPEEVLERCRRAAAQDGRSLSNYLARLLEQAHPLEGVAHRLARLDERAAARRRP